MAKMGGAWAVQLKNRKAPHPFTLESGRHGEAGGGVGVEQLPREVRARCMGGGRRGSRMVNVVCAMA